MRNINIDAATYRDIEDKQKELSREESILMIYSLLYDVRLDWSNIDSVEAKVRCAEFLCKKLGGDFDTLANECRIFLKDKEDIDGRYFRDEFPNGYQNMIELFNLTNTLCDKSETFKKVVNFYIDLPNYIFLDVEEVTEEDKDTGLSYVAYRKRKLLEEE